jgi:superkiller protein 8
MACSKDANECVIWISSHDSKAKIWRIETRSCVATHSHGDRPLWAARWLPKSTRSEMFALGGGNQAISFYREAAG